MDLWDVVFFAFVFGPVLIPGGAAWYALASFMRGRTAAGWAAVGAATHGAAGLAWIYGLVFATPHGSSTHALVILFALPVGLGAAVAGTFVGLGGAGAVIWRGEGRIAAAATLLAGIVGDVLLYRAIV